jgi:hypothetical protein
LRLKSDKNGFKPLLSSNGSTCDRYAAAEAHAEDEWPISSSRYNATRGPVRVTQPRAQLQRLALAQRFVQDFDPTVGLYKLNSAFDL